MCCGCVLLLCGKDGGIQSCSSPMVVFYSVSLWLKEQKNVCRILQAGVLRIGYVPSLKRILQLNKEEKGSCSLLCLIGIALMSQR